MLAPRLPVFRSPVPPSRQAYQASEVLAEESTLLVLDNLEQLISVVGPMINAFSPTTNVVMLLDPWQTIDGFADAPGNGRLGMTVAAFVAGAGYSFIVYVLIQGMVRGFDHTVRRLSGTT